MVADNNITNEIKDIKKELDSLNQEKESWFSKKDEIQKEINLLISEIKKLRHHDKSPLVESSNNKIERDKENAIVKELILKIKELNEKKKEILQKNKSKDNPERLFKLIESLETKIETEAISFEKEKEIMKKINSLKKQYSEHKELNNVFEEYNTLSKQIIEHKEKANKYHNLMRSQVNENKEENKKILDLSKKIISLRKQKEEALTKFLELKHKFKEKNDILKQKLSTSYKHRERSKVHKQNLAKEKQKIQESLLIKKKEQVEQKIKKKEKLTTEDLLAFQKDD